MLACLRACVPACLRAFAHDVHSSADSADAIMRWLKKYIGALTCFHGSGAVVPSTALVLRGAP
eukprot:13977230-Alexandrium_andersonii.AAC.1